MSEPAALDLAAITKRWIGPCEHGVGCDWCGHGELYSPVVGALVDELERCRAERDALREGLNCWLEWRAFPQDIDIEALLKITFAALGEVTQ